MENLASSLANGVFSLTEPTGSGRVPEVDNDVRSYIVCLGRTKPQTMMIARDFDQSSQICKYYILHNS